MLDALLVLHAEATAVPVAKLVALIGERAGEDAVLTALDDLRARALVWGDAAVRVSAEAAAGLPWYPGQAILEDAVPAGTEIAAAIDALDEPQRELLNRLVEGSPMGRTRDAAPGTPPDRPVQRLLAAGLLRQIDDDTVILPRQVGQVLRGEEPGPAAAWCAPDPVVGDHHAPPTSTRPRPVPCIDLLREVEVVLETLSATPVPELRSGGLGVREVKRLTKLTGIDEQRLGLDPGGVRGRRADRQRPARPRAAGRPRVRTGRRRWPPTGSSNPRPPRAGTCWPAPGWTCRHDPA